MFWMLHFMRTFTPLLHWYHLVLLGLISRILALKTKCPCDLPVPILPSGFWLILSPVLISFHYQLDTAANQAGKESPWGSVYAGLACRHVCGNCSPLEVEVKFLLLKTPGEVCGLGLTWMPPLRGLLSLYLKVLCKLLKGGVINSHDPCKLEQWPTWHDNR